MRKLEQLQNLQQVLYPKYILVKFTQQEFDTVIASLRLWQHDSAHIADGDGAIMDIAEDHGQALCPIEIDELIERVNAGVNEPTSSVTVEELAKDPCTPYWALDVINAAARRDPLDAALTLEVLAGAFTRRAESLLAVKR